MNKLKRLQKQFQIELKLFFREPIYIFFVLLLPAVSFIVFGSMYKNISYGGINFFQKYIPGLIAIIMYSSTIFGVGLQMVIDKESGVFKRLKAAPIKMRRIYAIVAIKGLFVSLIGLLEILILARFAFNAALTSHWVEFLIGFMVSITTLLTLGFLVASLFNNTRSAIAALMITFYPVFFLSDAAVEDDAEDICQSSSYH